MLEACRANRHTLLFLRWFSPTLLGVKVKLKLSCEFNVSEEDVRGEVV